MNTTLRFQKNPAGLNQVLTVLPGHISVNFNPKSVWQHLPAAEVSETMLILAGHCFILSGDFRQHYEQELAAGGIEACVQFYLDVKPLFGGQWSSSMDPWQMLAIAFTDALRDSRSASSWHSRPVWREMALAV